LKLDAPASPAPAAPITEPADDAGFDGLDSIEPEAAPADDKPFDDEPFDAGVEADEATDPKKFIEQLTGKLGQSLRKYTEEQGQPDFDLEKFAINSLLSATHTSEMDEEDKNDIIKKVNTAGNDDSEGSNMDDTNDNPDNADDSNDGLGSGDDSNDEFGGNQDEEGLEEYQIYENEDLFLKEPKKMSIFAPEGSNEFMEENRLSENHGPEEARILDLVQKLNKLGSEITPDNVMMMSLFTAGGTVTDQDKIMDVIGRMGSLNEKSEGLWANIRAKKERGESPAKPGDEDYPDKKQWNKLTKENENHESGESLNYMFWQNLKTIHHASGELLEMNQQQIDEMCANGHAWAVDHIASSADDIEEVYHFFEANIEDDSMGYDGETEGGYEDEYGNVEGSELYEGKYDGKPLGKPMKGDVKKFKVYVKNKKGNVIKVNFGDPNMEIKRDDPERRKSFRARHKCAQAKDRTTPKYWSCKMWSKTPVSKMVAENLLNPKKSSTFDKNYLVNKLHETFNQEDMKNAEPQTAPAPVRTPTTKPGETKPAQPTRRQKTFSPMPAVQPDPKAKTKKKVKEVETNGEPSEGQIIDVKQARESVIILDVYLNGSVVPVTFERDDLIEQPLAYDESWVYSFVSLDAPDGKEYTINASYLGHPDTDLDFQEIDSTHVELA
jgi:hypothetical protein